MSGVRFAPINEGLGEPEQDANSALTELDKGGHFINILSIIYCKIVSLGTFQECYYKILNLIFVKWLFFFLSVFKGLRSGKVGEQCEAIVRFPRLFEKYPFPILINSSFLKLADIFRVG